MKKKKLAPKKKTPERTMRGVRMSAAEWSLVKRAAAKHNMSPSGFIRAAALLQAGG